MFKHAYLNMQLVTDSFRVAAAVPAGDQSCQHVWRIVTSVRLVRLILRVCIMHLGLDIRGPFTPLFFG